MTRKDNIFYKVVKKDENTITELLCNLLRTKYIRDICLKSIGINEECIKNIKIENISTQKKVNDVGIPDIIIENHECFYIIENKTRISTGLQNNQKEEYIKALNSKKYIQNKGYRFIIPENYSHKNEIEVLKEKHSEYIDFVTWEKFLQNLFDMEIQKESPIINESLNYLVQVILNKPSLYNEDIILTPYEVAMLYNLKDVVESFKLCEKVLEKMDLIRRNLCSIPDLNLSLGSNGTLNKYFEGMVKYLNYKDNCPDSIAIGLNLNLIIYENNIQDKTIKIEEYVFSVALNKNFLKEGWSISESSNVFDNKDDNWIYIPLKRTYLLEDSSELLMEIERIIRNEFIKNVI